MVMAGELKVEPQLSSSYPLETCEMRSWNMVSVPWWGQRVEAPARTESTSTRCW